MLHTLNARIVYGNHSSRGGRIIDPVSVAGIALEAGAKTAIAKSTNSLVNKLSLKFAKDRIDTLTFTLNKGLPSYLEANYAKCETLKTLLNRNMPVALKDCFVAPDFKLGRADKTADVFLDYVNETEGKFIVTGLAGSGKSVFLKHAFRSVIEKGHTYYPIFFELRSLNQLAVKKELLLSAIFASVQQYCENFTRAQFNHGLKTGGFYILLDGFDELSQEARDQVADEISNLARKYHKCPLLVTSRPSDEFVSWEGFSEAELQPFDLEKVEQYITKLTYDEEQKRDFLADLKDGLFEKNKDFLSNPLLSAMMLLTYDSFGEIPEKRHIFYAKCFEVLSREHDASKGRYKRQLFSELSVEQIEKAFMFFCALSYFERDISFSEDQMKDYVNQAIEACGVEADIPDVIRDFRESISIMERVGLQYEFAHRSFQEYFYAKFVVTDREIPLESKVAWLIKTFGYDDTVEMIADMDRAYFEDEYLLPALTKLDRKLARVDTKTNPAGALSKFFGLAKISQFKDGDTTETKRKLVFLVTNRLSYYLWEQADEKYQNQLDIDSKYLKYKHNYDNATSVLDAKYGGKIKIHHTNNLKLIEIEAHIFAERIKQTISCFRAHLEQKQEKRKKGLGSLIRKKYRR
ncbi:MAG: NACHT domain-containing protein [Rhodobacteraceae bacterium]|nr:NACHT domain-containing protein [Paracoccaceae bacterium]